MDPTRGLKEDPSASPHAPVPSDIACPSCRAHPGRHAPLPLARLDARLRRCLQCGERIRIDDDELLPFAFPDERPAAADPAVVAAVEREVRLACDRTLRFLVGDPPDDYLRRIASRVASGLPGVPARPDVLLVDDDAWWAVALPSATVLITLGQVSALRDEAELAFVLAHELAHTALAHTAGAVSAAGLAVLADPRSPAGGGGRWLDVLDELVRVGFGDPAEHAADQTAQRAVTSAGYDGQASLRYLERLALSAFAGDARVAAQTLAHPPAAQRLRRLRRGWSARLDPGGASRVNREVFRRAIGAEVLARELSPSRPLADPEPRGRGRALRVALALAVLAVAAATLVAVLT